MAAPASTLEQTPPELRFAPADRTDQSGRHRFHILATGVTDVVSAVGGLIYDRAMAGWDVDVLVDGDRVLDDRPLRILGASVTRRVPGPLCAGHGPRLLAVAGDVLVGNDAVRREVLAAATGGAEVLLWGRHRPAGLGADCVVTRHRPSAAAHVFKSQALRAGGSPDLGDADERLFAVRVSPVCRP